jgi:ribosome-associated translation inhibitor RaiA
MFCVSEGEAILAGPIETGTPSVSSGDIGPPVPVVPPLPVARVVARRVCQVTFAGMLASEQARVEVHAWVERLGELTSPMTAAQVLIEAVDPDRRGRKERQYRVRMDLTMPTGVVVVDHDHPNNRPHEDLYVAIRNAFRAARRQLEVHREGLT